MRGSVTNVPEGWGLSLGEPDSSRAVLVGEGRAELVAGWTRPGARYRRWRLRGPHEGAVRSVSLLQGVGSAAFRVARAQPAASVAWQPDGTTEARALPAGRCASASQGSVVLTVEWWPWMAPRLAETTAELGRHVDGGGPVRLAGLPGSSSVAGDGDQRTVAAMARLMADADRAAVSGIAREVGWSTRTLRRRLRALVGLGPDELRRLSLAKRAQRALGSGERPAAVAARFGYVDQGHLSREFGRWCGYTPGAWQRHVGAWSAGLDEPVAI